MFVIFVNQAKVENDWEWRLEHIQVLLDGLEVVHGFARDRWGGSVLVPGDGSQDALDFCEGSVNLREADQRRQLLISNRQTAQTGLDLHETGQLHATECGINVGWNQSRRDGGPSVGLAPQIDIWNTNSAQLLSFRMSSPSAQTQSPPIEDFLATVLVETLVLAMLSFHEWCANVTAHFSRLALDGRGQSALSENCRWNW